MALRIPNSQTSTSTIPVISLIGADDLLVRDGVELISTSFAPAVHVGTSSADITNYGLLFGRGPAINFLDSSYVEIENYGEIVGVASAAINLAFSTSDHLELTNHGRISGGIFAPNSEVDVLNLGEITAEQSAISMDEGSNLVNGGTMASTGPGNVAVFANAGDVTINNSGEILGGGSSIHPFLLVEEGAAINLLGESGSNKIINSGLISNDGFAIDSSIIIGEFTYDIFFNSVDDHVINTGTIIGDIRLGGGSDTLDLRGGTFNGVANLGGGDDLLIVDDGTVVAKGGSGRDRVEASVSFTLGLGFEDLFLIGSEAINGTGTGAGNLMTGNAGSNVLIGRGGADTLAGGEGDDALYGRFGNDKLFGGDGDDTLRGGQGNDQMSGGGGADVFEFSRKGGTDQVLDFQQGADLLDFRRAGASDFSDLVINVQSSQVVVKVAGASDKMVLKDFTAALSEADFLF